MGMLLDLFRNKWPYTDFHELNADWIISTVRQLIEAMDSFIQNESISFADPITWNITTQYAKATVVIDGAGNAYLSKQAVPAGIQLNNSEYWQEIFNFTNYTRTANRNLTFNVETDTTRATAAYNVDDWLILNDVLYRVTQAIAIDDTFIIAPASGSNIEHFTVEDFIKAWITSATALINQYKDDIDASELAYRQQLAQDIASTTASLQAQLNAAIAGATVDSEVINARVTYDNDTFATLGDAIRYQISTIHNILIHTGIETVPTITVGISDSYITPSGTVTSNTGFMISTPIALKKGERIVFRARGYLTYVAMIARKNADNTYTLLARSRDSNVGDYGYTASDDMEVVLSYTESFFHKASIYSVNIIGEIDALNISLDSIESDLNDVALKTDLIDNALKNADIVTEIELNADMVDYYMTPSGVPQAATGFVITSPVTIKAGRTVLLFARGYSTNVAMISRKNSDGTYTTLQRSIDATNRYYTYTFNYDTEIVFSYNNNQPHNALSIYNIHTDSIINEYADLSLFSRIGIVGDSYASGEIYFDGAFHDNYDISWGNILAKKHGLTPDFYSAGGMTTRSFLSSSYGLVKALNNQPCDLYIMILGINDINSLGMDYLGSIEDITSHSSWSDYPNTFYGNYGKIFERIQAHAPHAKFIFSTIAINDTDVRIAYNNAILEIAEHYGVAAIKQYDDPFFNSAYYKNNMVNGHPIAIVYSGMANALDRLFITAILNNREYFHDAYMYT